MGTLLQDLRYGIRRLLRNPGFTLVSVLTLALGIGANTTIFSFMNALLLRPPAAVESPAELLGVWNRQTSGDYLQHNYPDYAYYRDHNKVFSGLLAYTSDPIRVSLRDVAQSRIIYGHLVSGNYFSVLGVKLALGRGFASEEDQVPGRNPVVVLAHAFWKQHFAADPNVSGKPLVLNGHSFTVVGVAPPTFTGLATIMEPDFWAPMMAQPQIRPGSDDSFTNRNRYWIFVVGRLKPGVTKVQAQADLSVLSRHLTQDQPATNRSREAVVLSATGVAPEFRSVVVPFTAVLMALVGLVLLIACANSANLLLAQAAGRCREMAIRSAIGASRKRLIRQVLTESILLACVAGGLALLLVLWTAPLLMGLRPAMLSFIKLNLSPDWRIAGFTFLVSLIAGLIFGLAPALRSSRFDVISRLKDGSSAGYRRSRLRNSLVITQIAVCLILLVSAALCVRSLRNAYSVDPGFAIDNRLAVFLDMEILGYSPDRGRRLYQELLDRSAALPGVVSASLANHLPLGFSRTSIGLRIAGHQPPAGQSDISVGVMAVGPGYFRAMEIPVLRGREFSARDNQTSPHAVVINEAMAKIFWPGQDPIGRSVTFGFDNRNLEIVGVAKTGKYRSLRDDAEPFMYQAFFQSYRPRAVLVLRSAGDPEQMRNAVLQRIREVDPDLPVLEIQTLKQYMEVPLLTARLTGTLLGAVGGLAILLALVGLYSAVAYTAAQRTQEFGIRMALGAQSSDVIRLVIREGLMLILIGLAIGLAGALLVTRVFSSLLYGIKPTDPLTFVAVSMALAAVALLASYIPARRASRIDPMTALRYE